MRRFVCLLGGAQIWGDPTTEAGAPRGQLTHPRHRLHTASPSLALPKCPDGHTCDDEHVEFGEGTVAFEIEVLVFMVYLRSANHNPNTTRANKPTLIHKQGI